MAWQQDLQLQFAFANDFRDAHLQRRRHLHLSYDYNLGGELKKITDATNMTINYGYDATGRLTSVTGLG